ncbi:LRR receptor-like serine/threonine-protein kinase [Pyrus ussuriensis x Pyrus communis]|uniref:LRR receptor-like serine/threonine-protein kinase n=1 Tax=Pyrus ussuriensis x Pyrus communis TaxID=2448454 RepID=A0A5N5H4H5_9ROSA|nr:LRR receptor-like serine/threonine-protein kinase [Pyrus ussuriensis x Pyrus communis]
MVALQLTTLSLRNCNLQWPILDFSRIPSLGYAQAKHWSRWSYLEEQTRMQFLLLHEVDVHKMDIHPVFNGRNLMSPSSAFLMQVITLG